MLLSSGLLAQTLYVPAGTGGISSSTNSFVGIGTNTPAYSLDIRGESSLGLQIKRTSNNAAGFIGLETVGGSFFTQATVNDFAVGSNTANLLLGARTEGMAIKFITKEVGQASSIKLIIDNSGKVGLGTLTPNALFDIKKVSPIKVTSDTDPISSARLAEMNVLMRLTNSWVSNGINEPTIIFDNGGTDNLFSNEGWTLGAQVAGVAYFRIGRYTGTGLPANKYYEYFRIHNNGYVGIGTDNPQAKLHIVGTSILNGKLQVGASGLPASNPHYSDCLLSVDGKLVTKKLVVSPVWADFVFDKDYNLRHLSEVEQYINENHHLPDVPSEKDVESSGIEVGEMNAILLRKIEEMTLYIIQLEKRVNQLETK